MFSPLGGPGGSAGESLTARVPPQEERKEPTPQNCPLTSTCVPWHACTHPTHNIYTNRIKKKCVWCPRWLPVFMGRHAWSPNDSIRHNCLEECGSRWEWVTTAQAPGDIFHSRKQVSDSLFLHLVLARRQRNSDSPLLRMHVSHRGRQGLGAVWLCAL